MRIRSLFFSKEGSTTLTVVISLALSIALLASCLQWYWVNSSSNDIQTVADLGALASMRAIAKSVMVIQTLDAFLLTVNIFGLVIHTVVIVAGIAVVASAPIGGAGAAPFLERAIQFDKEFCEKRTTILEQVENIARTINLATPLLALEEGMRSVESNQQLIGLPHQSQYVGVVIPAPLQGTVSMTSRSNKDKQLEKDVLETSEQNADDASEIKKLEEKRERLIDRCFALDVYKSASTVRAYWDPLRAKDDFIRQYEKLIDQSPPLISGPYPIEDNAQNRDRLLQRYKDDYELILSRAQSSVVTRIRDIDHISTSGLLASYKSEQILILEHLPNQRKAYHSRSNCFGLASATAPLHTYSLQSVIGDYDHPPCILCSATHWQSIRAAEDILGDFASEWNKEADAINEYLNVIDEIEILSKQVVRQTKSAFNELLDNAGSYLAGGRISYTPAGARGVWCIVVDTSSRKLPAYTLPQLTGAENIHLQGQVAISGSKMMMSKEKSTISTPLVDASTDARSSSSAGLSSVIRSLLGQSSSLVSPLMSIWDSCLGAYTSSTNSLVSWSQGLPWGLDTLTASTLKKVLEVAQATPPDLRKPLPVLVNSGHIGDQSIAGLEGAIARSIASLKSAYSQSAGGSTVGLKSALRTYIDSLQSMALQPLADLSHVQVLGKSVELPFSDEVYRLAQQGIGKITAKVSEVIYAMPDASF